MEPSWVESTIWMLWVVGFEGCYVFNNWNLFVLDYFFLYSYQWLQQQEALKESIRIFIYQKNLTYVKQTWHLWFSFEVA